MQRILASGVLLLALTACPGINRVNDDPLSIGSDGNTVPGDGSSGIEGVVLVGPQCPVMREDQPCPDAPLEARVAVKSNGKLVARFSSDAKGQFRVPLQPGAYRLEPESKAVFPQGIPQDLTVLPGGLLRVTVQYDSGIR